MTELAEFDGIVLVEWGDVASAGFGDHLEVRLGRDDSDHDHDHDRDESNGDESNGDESNDDESNDDDFGLDERRLIELQATGREWAGRWERLAQAVEVYRC